MNLPSPNAAYDQQNEAQARAHIEAADAQNLKNNAIITKLKFRDTADGTIKTVVMTSGAFVIS